MDHLLIRVLQLVDHLSKVVKPVLHRHIGVIESRALKEIDHDHHKQGQDVEGNKYAQNIREEYFVIVIDHVLIGGSLNDAVAGCDNDAEDETGVAPHEEAGFVLVGVVDQSLEGINGIDTPFVQEVKSWQSVSSRKGFMILFDIFEFTVSWQT